MRPPPFSLFFRLNYAYYHENDSNDKHEHEKRREHLDKAAVPARKSERAEREAQ